ncbi:MAG TPA: NRDE family protein [Methylibium sp.]|nr:NRDE family protein [Methylibium sp.]
MCLVALALGQSARFPLVLASNRDEFFDRPTAPLDWWPGPDGAPAVLAGRDLQAGGTWLGLSRGGRLALVTNVRDGRGNDPRAPSRGALVPDWLLGEEPFHAHWPRLAMAGHNGFNLVAADVAAGAWYWAGSRATAPQRLGDGLYGLSNAALDTPWPKVDKLKAALRRALREAGTTAALSARLFDALADPARADDALLPTTGVPLPLERELSAAWIRTADGRYGTRCSTLVITENTPHGPITQVIERSHGPQGAERRAALHGWPGRAAASSTIELRPLPS